MKDPVVAKGLVRWGAELLVVFVGVYGAFVLSEWREQRSREVLHQQLTGALVEEVALVQSRSKHFVEEFGAFYRRFATALEAGEKPPLTPISSTVRFSPYLWQASGNTLAIEVLGVPKMVAVSKFYNDLEMAFLELEVLERYSREVLLPNIDAGPSEFYEPDGTIRRKYEWYPAHCARLYGLARSVSGRGEKLLRQLRPETSRSSRE